MPDGRGSFLDVLDRATERGLDVRVLFWRHNPETARYGLTFSGTPAQRALLRDRGSRFRIRWDRAHGPFCQHQKSWLIDAGHPSETAFVGGINLTPGNLASPGHAGRGQRHDAYVEVAGPSATDVHHNFVQRWNEASERAEADGVWGHSGDDDLPFPTRVSEPRGGTLVQIQRNVHPGRYTDGRATPGGSAYAIAEGERSILAQYKQAIDAARRTIYIENQAVPVPEIAIKLDDALRRGVEVVALVPAEPEEHVRVARTEPGPQRAFRPARGARRSRQFHARRDRRAGPGTRPQRRLRPCQAHAGRRCLGDDRLLQSASVFALRPYRDERVLLGPGGRARAPLRASGRASGPGHPAAGRPRGASPLPAASRGRTAARRRPATSNGKVSPSRSIPRPTGHSDQS